MSEAVGAIVVALALVALAIGIPLRIYMADVERARRERRVRDRGQR